MARQRTRAPRTAGGSPLVEAAERMVGDIEQLVREMEAVRADNDALREELRTAVEMMERASAVLGGSRDAARTPGREAPGRRRRAQRGTKPPKGRATPPEVTKDVVRAALSKLGEASAAEIAAEITKAGVPVSGRAVRFLAEGAGATVLAGEGGQRRYRL